MAQGTEIPTWMLPPKQRVLLVDDDLLQLHVTRDRLEEAGYSVQIAANAEEALDKTQANPPDAILSNVGAGGSEGFSLCRKVREHARFANVPVILISTHHDDAEDRLSVRAGVTQLITRTPGFDAELSALETTLQQEAPVAWEAAGAEHYEQMLRDNGSPGSGLLDDFRDSLREVKRMESLERLLGGGSPCSK